MKRRSFLKAVGGAVGGSALGTQHTVAYAASSAEEKEAAGLPRRALGRTGLEASCVAFPGLALIHDEQPQCTAALHKAFDQGVNYFDVAPAYGDAEVKMGVGLQGLKRDEYILACKTKMRDKKGAREELDRSLRRLKTDHFDVYQMHCLKRPEEVEQALGPDGAMETILQAKQEGKVRFVGFSAHTTKGALAAMKQFRFDTVMFPINFVEYFTLGFGKPVLELAEQQGAGVLAIKAMSRGAWPAGVERTRRWWYRSVEEEAEVLLALRFTLSQAGVVAAFPPSFVDLLDKAVRAAPAYRPLTEAETAELRNLATTCESLFRKEEQQVAGTTQCHEPPYPDSPHECSPELYA
ncbi:MAG: aldo/keto reductase [Pirellulales bacterium]|nr:aldo/keto reductase [Pirellulales bacterium]